MPNFVYADKLLCYNNSITRTEGIVSRMKKEELQSYIDKFADVPRIKKAHDEFTPVRHLQRELMVSHREIAPQVFETAYVNGERTICNYAAIAFRLPDGRNVEPMSYVLIK